MKEELKEKYSTEYNNYTHNSLPYLYFKKGILPKDILCYTGIRLYMGILKLPPIDSYWSKNFIFSNNIPNFRTKNCLNFY